MVDRQTQRTARILTLALGATTAMWVFSYIALLFSGKIGGEILFVLGALCLPIAARRGKSLQEGAWIGIVSATLNLLLVGSIIGGNTPEAMVTTGIFWVVGLYVASTLLGVIGASFRYQLQDCMCDVDWHFGFITVASALVFLMLVSGGLVTGMEAGLAVPDWPNSYGHNMLLYPLSEMVSPENEGVLFEHAHRLTGMFVGLTSLIMVVCVWKWSSSRCARAMGITIFVLVCVQGLLGGLRVTEVNLWFGVVHGVVGQLIFTLFVCLAAMFSASWKSEVQVTDKKDARWALFLCITMVLQLVLGAVYRHMISDEVLAPKATHVLYTHIAIACVVLLFAVVVGIRCMQRDVPILKKLGISLHVLVLLQILLGGGALVVILISKGEQHPLYEVIVTTLHQANGALLLAASFVTYAYVLRFKK